MPEYTVAAALAAVAVVALELAVLRTGLFRQRAYWITMAIVAFFQVLVDGWLTKLSAPIVLYDDGERALPRAPWDIPVEDFVYGFALLTLVLLLWERARPGGGHVAADEPAHEAVHARHDRSHERAGT